MADKKSKSKKPLVSVILATYYAEKYIANTLDSILNQTYDNLEVLIYDDLSKDSTMQIIKDIQKKDPRIKIFTQKERVGPYNALNYLLDNAQGDYIAVQDHDDLWHSTKIQTQVEFLEQHPEYVGSGTGRVTYYEGKEIYTLDFKEKEATHAFHTTLMFRKTAKRYPTTIQDPHSKKFKIPVQADIHFMRYILSENQKKIYNIDKPLCVHRIRMDGNNITAYWVNWKNVWHTIKDVPIKTKIYRLYKFILPPNVTFFLSTHVLSPHKYFKTATLHDSKELKEYTKYIKS